MPNRFENLYYTAKIDKMANLKRYILPACLMVSVGATALGCDDATESRTGKLKVDVIGWGPGVDGALGFQTQLPSFSGAQRVRVSLTKPGTAEVIESETFAATQKSARLPKLENGDGLRLEFELLDPTSQPLAFGATPLFSFDGEQFAQNFRIQVDPTNDFAPVGAVLGGSMTQTIFDTRAINAMSMDRWLGRVGHRAVPIDGGNGALIVGGGDAIAPVRAGAEPNFRTPSDGRAVALHDDVMDFDPNTGFFSDLSFNSATAQVFPGGADRLAEARAFHTVTPIGDERFLVVGGYGEVDGALGVLDSIELIDLSREPGSRVNVLMDSSGAPLTLNMARVFHSATYRPADNSVVVVGGVGDDGPTNVLDSVEVINLTQNTVTQGPPLNSARAQHEALLMPDNQTIWVLGGRDATDALKSTATIALAGAVSSQTEMTQPRYGFEAVRASALDGSVVVAIGGFSDLDGAASDSVELGKLGRDSFSVCGACELATARGNLRAVELPNSLDIVVLGGRDASNSRVSGAEVLKFNSLTESNPYSASATGTESTNERADSSATLLTNGKILLTGGFGASSSTLRDAEYFTPSDFASSSADTDSSDTENN